LDIIDGVLEGDFDLVVTGQKGDLPDRMRSWVLFREPCNVMVPGDHRFARKKTVAIRELEGESIIERTGCCMTPAFRALCDAAGIMPDVRHRAASEEHLQQLVIAGFGCGIVPRTLPVVEGLVSVPLEGNTLERDVVIATVAGRRFSIAADAFVKVVRARDWSEASSAWQSHL
jgi:DNA-binding transcriptional LysR family regulator